MLRSNWHAFLAVGIAAFIAILAAGIIYGDTARLQRDYQHAAEQNAQAYRDSARIHAGRTCARVPSAEISECVHAQYHAARERERSEYDLQAQLVTSAWTRSMGIAALIAMLVGIIGVGLVYVTFHETRRAANEQFKANQISTKQVQANLTIENAWLQFANGKAFVKIEIKNNGQTVAHGCSYLISTVCELLDEPPKRLTINMAEKVSDKALRTPLRSIAPGATVSAGFLDTKASVPPNPARAVVVRMMMRLDYRTIFGDEIQDEYRALASMMSRVDGPMVVGNEAPMSITLFDVRSTVDENGEAYDKVIETSPEHI